MNQNNTNTSTSEPLPQNQEKEISSFKLIFTLGIAGFISGWILVGIYLVTKPKIEENKAKALRQAIYKVLPGCKTYQTLLYQNGALVLLKEEEKAEQMKKIFAGYNDANQLIGFAIPGSEPGFQDIIGAIYGYDASKKVIIGFYVLESKETPGLGDKIMKDANFKANFTSLAIIPEIVPVKPGKKKNPNEVETITGATISSKAVVRLLQKSIDEWRPVIEKYIQDQHISLRVNHDK